MAPAGVSCVSCNPGYFSYGGNGATCIGCPTRGVTCVSGKLSLLAGYFQPPQDLGKPLGPETELHVCYNAEACSLNASSQIYGCSYWYTGPLCGVCDETVDYARFGKACAKCWPTALSGFILMVFIIILLALAARIALRASSATHTPAAIALRILLSFIQAIGSLKAFVAGGTRAYRSIFDWTDSVFASPFSTGMFACLFRLDYTYYKARRRVLPPATPNNNHQNLTGKI